MNRSRLLLLACCTAIVGFVIWGVSSGSQVSAASEEAEERERAELEERERDERRRNREANERERARKREQGGDRERAQLEGQLEELKQAIARHLEGGNREKAEELKRRAHEIA